MVIFGVSRRSWSPNTRIWWPLINRLKELAGVGQGTLPATPGTRTYRELVAIADDLTAQHTQKAATARQKRLQYLEKLAPRQAQT